MVGNSADQLSLDEIENSKVTLGCPLPRERKEIQAKLRRRTRSDWHLARYPGWHSYNLILTKRIQSDRVHRITPPQAGSTSSSDLNLGLGVIGFQHR